MVKIEMNFIKGTFYIPGNLNLLICAAVFVFLQSILLFDLGAAQQWLQYENNPFKIVLHPAQISISGRGGIIVCDLNGDGLFDYIVSTKENNYGDEDRATIGAYDHNGDVLWLQDNIDLLVNGNAENYGLPGWHGPGISAGDVDGDGNVEVVYLSTKNEVIISNGQTGEIKKTIYVPLPGIIEKAYNSFLIFKNETLPSGFKHSKTKIIKHFLENPKRWSHFQIVNLEGQLDNEIILQADPSPFRWLKAISLETGTTLWEFHEYMGCRHNGFRAADIDGDGFDEVVGGVMIDHDGTLKQNWTYRNIGNGHLDSLFIQDIVPNEPGLEWVVLEEIWSKAKDRKTALLGKNKIFFYHSNEGLEPQNAAIGEFDVSHTGLEIWCRSRFEHDQRPWVISSSGETIASYRLNDRKPKEWSDKGIEVIYPIDWMGSPPNFIAAKERGTKGNICIIDPMTGKFLLWWPENADRIYVADVAGDYREEIIVINSKEKEIRVYWNEDVNLSKKNDRNWSQNYYKRQKLNYNYYSP